MGRFQNQKQLMRDYYQSLDSADTNDIAEILEEHVSSDYFWRGFHPFNELNGAGEVADTFWSPLRQSLKNLQRRQDIFMAGVNSLPETAPADSTSGDPDKANSEEPVWVVSMGHLMGLFDEPWLGIPATHKLAMLRYCEFNKVVGQKITETAMYFDIPHLMAQAGMHPWPNQTAAQLVQPGPVTHTGLMFDAQDPEEGAKTLAAIDFMVEDIRTWQGGEQEGSLVDELRRSWNDDMIWWGPTGIGATYTIERYAEQHSGPFRDGLKDRKFNGHVCRMAEGEFGAFFGWPNLTVTPNGFMGMPPSDTPGDMRVIDVYRRDGQKLSENWIFIDLLHFWKSQGHDVLAQMNAH